MLSQSSLDSKNFGEIKRLNEKLNDIEKNIDNHLNRKDKEYDMSRGLEESTKDTIKDITNINTNRD